MQRNKFNITRTLDDLIRRLQMDREDLEFYEELDDDEILKEEFGFIDFLDDDEINEVIRMSVTRTTRDAKLRRLGGSMAARLAKQRKDPDYKKMIKFKKLWVKYKQKVMRKYGMRGKAAARKAAAKSK